MTEKPGLVVLDLDGTVVPYSTGVDEPSARVRDAIAGVIAAGIPVTVATGRAVWGALHGVHALGMVTGGPLSVVCSNGAVLYDVVAGRVTHRVTIDPAPAVRALLEVNPRVGLAVEYGTEGYRYSGAFEPDFVSNFVGMVDVPTLISEPTVRLVCRLPGDDTDPAKYEGRRRAALDLVTIANLAARGYSAEVGFSGWIDVAARGVSKASGAAVVAATLGVDRSRVVAVGDGTNDLALFGWAGRSVAMGQAPERVRAAADEVTGSVDDDGVAQLLERWLG
ncbi:MAG: HAD family hydrolase [Actinocatenispora sp.]